MTLDSAEREPQKLILVAEDVADMRDCIALVLRNVGRFKVITAKNGAEAVLLAQQERPDLILMDVGMPVMDGYEACFKLKDIPETRDIPVVFLSAKVGVDSGSKEVILKPCDLKFLVDRVREIMCNIRLGVYED